MVHVIQYKLFEPVKAIMDKTKELSHIIASRNRMFEIISESEDSERLEQALRDGGDPNARVPELHNISILMWAASHGTKPMCEILIEAGADILASDDFGRTAFHWAMANENEETAGAIIAAARRSNAHHIQHQSRPGRSLSL